MTYEELLTEAENNELTVKEKPLPISKGRIKGSRIAVRKGLTEKEKACVLAEEIGHYHTTSGNILDQSSTANRKQERTARLWAYNRMIGLTGIIDCYRAGCRNSYEMADRLEVTEKFLTDALACYKQKYGICTKLDNYVIYFEPSIGVFELR